MSPFLSRYLLHIGRRVRGLLQTSTATTFSQISDAAAAAAAATAGDRQVSLTVSYLIRSCGLPSETALSVSKKLRLDATENPDAVLGLLKHYGCSGSHISTIIAKLPVLLRMKAGKTLKPKLEFLRGAGISGRQLAALLSSNPKLLLGSLEKTIVPSLDMLKGVLSPGVAVTDALRLSRYLDPKTQVPNIQTLRRHGVPDAGISRLLVTRPQAMTRSPVRFEETVAAVKGMGLGPRNPMFAYAVGVMSFMSKAAWDRKLALYRSLGWPSAEISAVFLKQPSCLSMSDDKIRQKTEFFASKLGLPRSAIFKDPTIMTLSLGKRVAPRCSVLELLMSRGALRRRRFAASSVLKMSEKDFVERFVTRYRDQVPEVVDAHQGKVEFNGFGAFKGWVDSGR